MLDASAPPGAPGSPIRIRPFTAADQDAVLALAGRLLIGVAPWLDRDTVLAGIHGWVQVAIDGMGADRTVLVAEHDGHTVGFVSVERQQHWAGFVQAYIGELVVAAEVEGRGVGQALLDAVEAWARARGCAIITVDTVTKNARARHVYARHGFIEESVTLMKQLE